MADIAQATDIAGDTDTTITSRGAVYYGMTAKASGAFTDGVVVRTGSQTGAVIDRMMAVAGQLNGWHYFGGGIHCPQGIYVQTDALSTGTTIYWAT